jgi:hypothetical protein
MTAVEWLVNQLKESIGLKDMQVIEQAKEMERQKAHEYAEFAIRCDRMNMKILNFEDWIKLETFKSE